MVSENREPDLAQAEAVLSALDRSGVELFAPAHWTAGTLGVLVRVEPDMMDEALLVFHDMRPTVIASLKVLKKAADLAVVLNHHLFDTLYHAVAFDVDATLVTADERYFAKAFELGNIVRLADFRL